MNRSNKLYSASILLKEEFIMVKITEREIIAQIMGEDYDIDAHERSEMLKEVSKRLKELQEAGLEVPYKMVLKD